MKFVTIHDYIVTRFKESWKSTKIREENIKFSTPSSDYVGITVLFNPDANRNLGADRILGGLIDIDIYVKKGMGVKSLYQYVDDIVEIFENQTFNGVKCDESTITHVGEDAEWFKFKVSTKFNNFD